MYEDFCNILLQIFCNVKHIRVEVLRYVHNNLMHFMVIFTLNLVILILINNNIHYNTHFLLLVNY